MACVLYKHTIADALDGKKTCTECAIRLEFSYFRKVKGGSNGLAAKCRKCENAYGSVKAKEYRNRHNELGIKPYYHYDKIRARKLRDRYGLTPSGWDDLFESQGRACAICKRENAPNWHTDHCHATNKVRGILCYRCNTMLGHARDNKDTLSEGIKYLDRHGVPAAEIVLDKLGGWK